MIVLTSLLIILIAYLILVGYLCHGFDKVEDFKLQDLSSKTKFSIIISFRDEAEHLALLLHSISQLNYSKALFEVIMVNDASEDDSVRIIHNFITTNQSQHQNNDIDLKIIENKRVSASPKKDAIHAAISISKYDWLITTDADCLLPTFWLDTFDECIQINKPTAIVAPVKYHHNSSFFYRFQALDMLSLQGVTIGSFGIGQPLMCNGANFGYQKSAFTSVDGFEGNQDIASGDDVFLLQKLVKKDRKKVYCLKSNQAIVTTFPAKQLTELIHQRVRWASKTKKYNDWFPKIVGLLVFSCNLLCLALLPLLLFGKINLKTVVAAFVIKFSIDLLLLFKTARFFKQENLLISFLSSSLLYPFLSIYIILRAQIGSYKWKRRTFKT